MSRDASRVHGIVLAGVHHWDGCVLERVAPRPLLPVVLSPLITYALRWLRDAGVTRATVCANSVSRHVRGCLGDGSRLGMDLDYFEDNTPRGPAGCAHDAAAGADADTFIIVYGSIVPVLDLGAMLERHRVSQAAMTVGVTREGVGRDELLHPNGVYVIGRSALEYVARAGYQDIKEALIPRLHTNDLPVLPYAISGMCPRVIGPDSYVAVNEWVLRRLLRMERAPSGYRRLATALVHESAEAEDSARLIGPIVIGPGARIGPDATIVGPAVVGADCAIDAGAMVSRSLLWDRCRVGSAAAVDQCVLTHDVRLAPGARLRNVVETAGRIGRRSLPPAVSQAGAAALEPGPGLGLEQELARAV